MYVKEHFVGEQEKKRKNRIMSFEYYTIHLSAGHWLKMSSIALFQFLQYAHNTSHG